MKAGEMSKSESVTRIFRAELAFHVCVLFVTPEALQGLTFLILKQSMVACLFIY